MAQRRVPDRRDRGERLVGLSGSKLDDVRPNRDRGKTLGEPVLACGSDVFVRHDDETRWAELTECVGQELRIAVADRHRVGPRSERDGEFVRTGFRGDASGYLFCGEAAGREREM